MAMTADAAEAPTPEVPAPPTRGEQYAGLHGPQSPLFPTIIALREMTLAQALSTPDPGYISAFAPAVLFGHGVLPGVIARHSAQGATIVPVRHPGQAPPEPGYRPSATLADFVRCRDLTCRFPGCKQPATTCDVDHTIPWPYGPTQASNLKCLCRHHHLVKTFWSAILGWRDRQLPDGTVTWTDPDGGTHTTEPGSRSLFPRLCAPTAPTIPTGTPPADYPCGLTMPRRRTTRAQDRLHRIHEERERNRTLIDAHQTALNNVAERRAAEERAETDSQPPPSDAPF